MNKVLFIAFLCSITSFGLLGQKTVDVFKDIWTFPPLESDEIVHYLENDSLLSAESLKTHREILFISTSSKKGSPSIYPLATLAEKTAKEIGCNALSVSYFRSNGKADTLSVKFFSLTDSQLKKLCPTKGQSNKVLTLGLVEVSQVVGEIMQDYLQKNGE